MATTNQTAASALGVTLTGNQQTDNDAISHALSLASEAQKEAFFGIGANSGNARQYIAQNFIGDKQITTVLNGDNKTIPVSSLSGDAAKFYDSINSEHADTASELDNILNSLLGPASTSDHVMTANNNTISSSGGIHAVIDDGSGDSSSTGGGGSGGGSDTLPPTSHFAPPSSPHGISLVPQVTPDPVYAAPEKPDNTPRTSGSSSSGSTGSGSTGSNSSSSGNGSGVDPTVQLLADLIGQQTASGGGSGGGGGIVALPTPLETTDTNTASSGPNYARIFLLLAIVVGGIWAYKHYHAKRASAK